MNPSSTPYSAAAAVIGLDPSSIMEAERSSNEMTVAQALLIGWLRGLLVPFS